MQTRLLLGLVAAGTLILTGCYLGVMDGGMRQHRDFHYTFPLQAGGRVSVETFNGGVEISGWDENTVEIDGSKWGPTSEAADALRIDIDHTPEAVSVHVVRPVDWRGSLGARFTLKVPRGAMLDRIVSTNGSIRAEDAAGPAHLRTTNGSIRAEHIHGAVEAQTTNGSVNLTRVDGDVNLRTTNGACTAWTSPAEWMPALPTALSTWNFLRLRPRTLPRIPPTALLRSACPRCQRHACWPVRPTTRSVATST